MMAPGGELVVANALEAGPHASGAGLELTTYSRGSAHGGHAKGCLKFAAKYGFVYGMMSETGLAVNEHTLDLAVYQEAVAGADSLCSEDFGSWAMGLHATVAELSAALPKVRLVGRGGGQWGVQDATGASVVVEYVKVRDADVLVLVLLPLVLLLLTSPCSRACCGCTTTRWARTTPASAS